NYKAALLDPKSEKWLNAMNVEMQSMKNNEVWILVELPPNGKTVGSKWLFKKKTNMDGNVHTYKARLVVNGYTQTLGIDYEETFSSVADIRAIRILIAIATYYDYEIWQMDVKTAFLNRYLNEEMFAMKDLGEAAYILGIKIYRDRSRQLIGLCQSAYIEKILKRYCKENSKRGSIPMQEKLKLSKSQEAKYIAAFDASKEAVWVRKFISGLGVVPTIKEPISMYCDNTRAIAIANESRITKGFISGLGVVPTIEEPISMYCDNTRAIAIANESRITKGARHFRAKVHYLREVIEYGDINLEKVHMDDNLADPFTKALAFPKHS
nr:retrotransposon protein, putative, Ty1-copia subclass [Tanacetum cinerariifolium]